MSQARATRPESDQSADDCPSDPETRLRHVYERAQREGLIGRATSISHEMAHAVEMAKLLVEPGSVRCLDLGTGAGLPGLILATRWPTTTWVFLDRRPRSEAFVSWALGVLGMTGRAAVRCGDAAEVARESECAGSMDVVVARAFGPPATTLECATGFLRVGGRLVVSEPAVEDPDRWPPGPLALLGLEVVCRTESPRFAEIRKVGRHQQRYPRRFAAMSRRPLY